MFVIFVKLKNTYVINLSYDADDGTCTAIQNEKVRLLHDNRKKQVQCQLSSHTLSSHLSLAKTTLNVHLSYIELAITSESISFFALP